MHFHFEGPIPSSKQTKREKKVQGWVTLFPPLDQMQTAVTHLPQMAFLRVLLILSLVSAYTGK